MAYDALAVANYFLDKAEGDGRNLTPMGIQKMVYFAHGWHLAIRDQPLILQRVQAWDYGPVIPDIYSQFKQFGKSPITRKATRWNFDELPQRFDLGDLKAVEPKINPSDTASTEVLDKVWQVYRGLTAVQLSNLTHLEGTPWFQTRQQNADRRAVIDDNLIKQWFVAKAKENAARQQGTA